MDVAQAIERRRAVRRFIAKPVADTQMRMLIDAAIQAPSAMNAQPWGFVVIEDPALLGECAERAKAHYLTLEFPEPYRSQAREVLSRPGLDIFHGAPALVVIYARSDRHDTVSDCFLAAQNLMLAACAAGLGTCPIGFARPYFALPEVKRMLGVASEWSPALPLVVGHPCGPTAHPGRQPAVVLAWRRQAPARVS